MRAIPQAIPETLQCKPKADPRRSKADINQIQDGPGQIYGNSKAVRGKSENKRYRVAACCLVQTKAA